MAAVAGRAQRSAEGTQAGDGSDTDRGRSGHDERGGDDDRRLVGREARLQPQLLGREADDGRDAGHRECAECRCDGGDGHDAHQAAEAVELASAHLVVDDAGHEEEPGLVERVRQQQRHGRHERRVRSQAQQQHHRAQRSHRRVGQHQLQVVLAQRQDVADEHGQAAADDEQDRPQLAAAQDRRQARDEVDAGSHHGGRMQVRADRRRRGHRVGQPEVEGELRRLGERAQQDEHHEQDVARVVADARAGGAELGDGERLRREAQQHQARQHRQLARDGDDEGLLRRQPRGADGVLEADEQVGRHAGQAPEDDQQQQVVGQHQAEHRGHEGQRQRMEAIDLRVAVEVALGVEDDGRADTADEQGEQQRERVQRERQGEPELRHPLGLPAHGRAVDDTGGEAGEQQREDGPAAPRTRRWRSGRAGGGRAGPAAPG